MINTDLYQHAQSIASPLVDVAVAFAVGLDGSQTYGQRIQIAHSRWMIVRRVEPHWLQEISFLLRGPRFRLGVTLKVAL